MTLMHTTRPIRERTEYTSSDPPAFFRGDYSFRPSHNSVAAQRVGGVLSSAHILLPLPDLVCGSGRTRRCSGRQLVGTVRYFIGHRPL